MQDSNALYYTFSTIAQTLGAAIALLGAFVLYRLQGLNTEVDHIVTQQILPHCGGTARHALDQLHAERKHREFLLHVPEAVAPQASEHLHIPLARLREVVASRSSLLRGFRIAVISTVAVTTLAVAVLAWVPCIAKSAHLSALLLVLGICAFLGCLVHMPGFYSAASDDASASDA